MQDLKNVRWNIDLQFFGRKFRVALDDGHGHETAGKRTPAGYRENYFNEPVVQKLAKLLKDDGRFEVYEVAAGDSDVPLTTRTNRANDWGADIYISVHYNAMGFSWSTHIGGIETFSYPGSSTGRKLADCLHKQLVKGTKLYDRGLKTANFHVLRESHMAAALVECGFMDVEREAELMKSDAYRQECANELYIGSCDYFNIEAKTVANQPISEQEPVWGVGDKGAEVAKLEAAFKEIGYKIEVDGVFDNALKQVVIAFQEKYELEVDGLAGPNTIAKLDVVLAKLIKRREIAEQARKEAEEKKRKEEELKDAPYYRVMSGYFDSIERYNEALKIVRAEYDNVIFEGSEVEGIQQTDQWKLRFYSGRTQGKENAEKLLSKFETLFPSWTFYVIEA